MLDVVKGVYQAWNDGDADAFVADYVEDASAVLPGMHMKSRQDIRAAMAFSFSGPLKGTRSSDTVLDARLLNDDTAIVISKTGVLLPGESEAPAERTVHATWVLGKQGGKWLVAAYANSPTVAPGQ